MVRESTDKWYNQREIDALDPDRVLNPVRVEAIELIVFIGVGATGFEPVTPCL